MTNPNLTTRTTTFALCVSLLAAAAWAGPAPRTTADMKVGQMVEIEGRALGAQMVLADEVEVQRFAGPAKFEGAIQAVDADAKTVTVLGIEVRVSPETRLELDDGNLFEFSEFKTRQVIEVQGTLEDNGAFAASEIEFVDEIDVRPQHASLESPIQEVDGDANTMVVLGVKVKLTPTTEIEAQ